MSAMKQVYTNPMTSVQVTDYADTLRKLLASLDWEVVSTAIVGERKGDLLHSEREEMDRFREFLHRRIGAPLERLDLRGCGLALLDAFKDELLSAEHISSPHGSESDPIGPLRLAQPSVNIEAGAAS